MAVATSQLGVHEGKDSGGWNNDNPYGLWYGMNNAAWCNIYAYWVAYHAGIKGVPKGAYTPATALWYQNHGRWHKEPKVGDQFYKYGFTGKEWRIHHTGWVIKILNSTTFLTSEGNTNNSGSAQGDGVYKLKRTEKSLGAHGGFGRPLYVPVQRKAIVDISTLQKYVKTYNVYPEPVASALKKKGCSPNKAGAKKWQEKLGFTGGDADGLLGKDSLEKLGFKTK